MDRTILAVDDDAATLLYLQGVLEKEGYRVWTAGGGEEALEMLRSGRPDLLLLDVHMPGMSGYELLERVREGEPREHTPAIFLTVKDTREDEKRGLKEGVVDFLSKDVLTPDRVAILCYRLRNLFAWQENERLRGVLATIVSANHEINNPLMVIQARADLLRMKGGDHSAEEFREALLTISDSCQRIKGVMERISGAARWEMKTYLPGVEMLDLDAVRSAT